MTSTETSAADAAPESPFATLCEAFDATSKIDPGAVALRDSQGSVEITWEQYAARVRAIAGGLARLGVTRGDTVAIMHSNRPEFHLVDTAAFHLGATPFSVYPTLPPADVAYLFENAQNAVAIVDEQFVGVVEAAAEKAGNPQHIVCIDGPADGATTSLQELEDAGAPEGFDFEATWRAVEPEDVLTLIYTSGTTGNPKGVETTHANMLAQCAAVSQMLPIAFGDTITSYLPSAHIADRWSSHYNSIVHGVQITDVADLRQISAVLPELRPTLWGGVPRVFEKLVSALQAGIGADEDEGRRSAVQGAIEAGIARVRAEQAGEPIPDDLQAKLEQAEPVLAGLRAKLGLDHAKWIICGAAPLSRDVYEFMLGLGLPMAELYGMSECSCVVTTLEPDDVRVGSVGRPIPGLQARVAEDGELLLKGPTIMRGYRNEPEKTAETIDSDGWLHSGDICEIDSDGFVRIVDRKKELIINAAGKNMSPANIEQALKSAHPLIGQAIAIGDNRPYNVALLVLDPDTVAAKMPGRDVADVARDADVREQIDRAVAEANEHLARVEQIKRYELLAEEWEPGGDELTPTMKLKRKPINEKYGEAIEALYARD